MTLTPEELATLRRIVKDIQISCIELHEILHPLPDDLPQPSQASHHSG